MLASAPGWPYSKAWNYYPMTTLIVFALLFLLLWWMRWLPSWLAVTPTQAPIPSGLMSCLIKLDR